MCPNQLVFLLFVVCGIFLSSVIVYYIPFFARSVQLIYSILLQHHIWKLSTYFWSAFLILFFIHTYWQYVYWIQSCSKFALDRDFSNVTAAKVRGVPASMLRQYIIDTARNLCMCTSMLTYCDFHILQGKDTMSLRAETGWRALNSLSVTLATGSVKQKV